MANSPSFVQHALELLESVGPVQARAMFGGHMVSLNGASIGIIDDDWLFLCVDELTRPRFEAAGSRPFTYPSKKGEMVMNGYWALPEEAIDDPERAAPWARLAAESSARAQARRAAKRSKKPRNAVTAKAPARSARPPAAKAKVKASARRPVPARPRAR